MQPLVVSALGQTNFSNILKYFEKKYFLIKTSVDFNLNNFCINIRIADFLQSTAKVKNESELSCKH